MREPVHAVVEGELFEFDTVRADPRDLCLTGDRVRGAAADGVFIVASSADDAVQAVRALDPNEFGLIEVYGESHIDVAARVAEAAGPLPVGRTGM